MKSWTFLLISLWVISNPCSAQIGNITEPNKIEAEVEIDGYTLVLISNGELRDSIYRKTEVFSNINDIIEEGDLGLAAWTMIKHFQSHYLSVSQIVDVLIGQKIIDQEYFSNAFFKYVYADPTVMNLNNNMPILEEIEKFEEYRKSAKTLSTYVSRQMID